MALELINAVAATATLVVLGASVAAAVIQLRHMRAANELAAVLSVETHFRSRDVQDALLYVQDYLAERMADPAYRDELRTPGYVDPRRHPELTLCNWFNQTGALVSAGFLKEDLFLNTFGRLVEYYWRRLGPVVALMRRSRGPGQYEGFEYLAQRAQLRAFTTRRASYPRNARRLAIVDPWLAADTAADTSPP